MQALKKAEQAKKQALPTSTETDYPVIDSSLSPVAAPEIPTPEKPFEPLSIASQPELQLSISEPEPAATPPVFASAPAPVATSMALQDLAPPASPAPGRAEPRQSVDQAMQSQQQAQALFTAKQATSSSRRWLLIGTLLTVSIVCGAAVFYFWQVYGTNVLISKPLPAASIAASPNATGPVAVATPKTDKQVDVMVTKPAGLMHPKPHPAASVTQVQTPTPKSENGADEQIQIHKTLIPATINAYLLNAYQLFTAGDSKGARPLYEKVLQTEPNNRDALLGMAAIALNSHQQEQAAALYSHLLDLDPTDADAIAGLTSLRRGSPELSESQLKKVLAHNPQSGPTLFELGNLYSRQSRWSEAQEVYFRALGSTPTNADYAYNLAISLDRLGQNRLALEYYQKAQALATKAPGNFSEAVADKRIGQLQSAVSQ